MRRLTLPALTLMAFVLGSCGQNPLLKIAAADYSPWSLGSSWTYAGARNFQTRVTGKVVVGGRQALAVSSYYNAIEGTVSSVDLYEDGATVQIDSPTLGWVIDRKLPYVLGNQWSMPSPGPGVTILRVVDGMDNIQTSAGTFDRCYRLRDEISTYAAGLTTTTGDFIWVAPDVGDVQYASIDASGNSTVTERMNSYSLGQ